MFRDPPLLHVDWRWEKHFTTLIFAQKGARIETVILSMYKVSRTSVLSTESHDGAHTSCIMLQQKDVKSISGFTVGSIRAIGNEGEANGLTINSSPECEDL